MFITFNGAKTEIDNTPVTVSDFLKSHNYTTEWIAVEINEVIIPKSEYESHIIKDNDVIEVLNFVGGGCR